MTGKIINTKTVDQSIGNLTFYYFMDNNYNQYINDALNNLIGVEAPTNVFSSISRVEFYIFEK